MVFGVSSWFERLLFRFMPDDDDDIGVEKGHKRSIPNRHTSDPPEDSPPKRERDRDGD